MTDLDKWESFLNSMNIGFEFNDYAEKGSNIILMQGEAKIDGYSCFYTRIEFNSKGVFETIGAWE